MAERTCKRRTRKRETNSTPQITIDGRINRGGHVYTTATQCKLTLLEFGSAKCNGEDALKKELSSYIKLNVIFNQWTRGSSFQTLSAIYGALRISNSARKLSTVGEVVNLMAVDAQRITEFLPFSHLLWSSQLTIIAAVYFLWQLLGPAALAGLAVMIVLIPINTLIAKKVKTLQMRQMKYKDERIKVMNEVLSGIKALKLYAWEPSFKNQILKIREKEIALLKTAALWNASTSFVWVCSSFLVSFATFGVFVFLDERNVLTAEIAFVATALFNIIRNPISFFPMMVQMLIQFLVAAKRINAFLNAEEIDENSVSHDETKEEPLIIENGSFSWGTESTDLPILRNITLKVQPGQLVAVVGAVGSGKSSLISAFLGEMDKVSGYVNTKGRIAYVPQQAWIQNTTVKENILFGSNYESKKYSHTVEACALRQDLDMLPGGDSTEIGEKGINLSGGQKQRVSLARAVYNDADIYLLDDPLSAVDAHVGKHIFESVIGPRGELRRKTRILVTHAVTFLNQVDFIVVLKAGEITEMGTFRELLAKKGEFSDFLVQHITDTDDPELESEIEEMLDDDDERMKLKEKLKLSKSGSARSSISSVSDTELNDTDVHVGGFSLDNGPDVVIASPEPLYLDYDSDIIPATPEPCSRVTVPTSQIPQQARSI
ncbi:Canalicular multispecific organic anion transporter 1 [Homalodisca vitripennis]|nr:Canalicular multispecific organic anion transporter 1 [Homalodisca vitripennis]